MAAYDIDMNMTAMFELLDVPGHFNFTVEDFMRVYEDFRDDNRWLSKQAEISIITAFIFIIVLGLMGNSLVFYIIARKGCGQSSRNWYILNLAGSDILTCAVCKPLTIVRLVLKDWVLGETLCKLVPCLQTVYVFVSTFTLVALAVDRYSSIMYNNHQVRFKPCVYVCVIWIWLVSVAISVPLAVVHDIEHVKSYNGNVIYSLCLEQWESEVAITTYTVLLLLLQYLSPLIAIIVLHFLIGRFLRSRLHSNMADDVNIRRKRRRHRKNILLLSSMAVSFGVAWFPLHFISALATINPYVLTGIDFPLVHAICLMIAFSSVCINPLIYGILNTSFRRDLVKLCSGHQPPYSIYTDYTRRSSPNPEALGLISSTPQEIGLSSPNLLRVRNGNCVSAL